MSDTTAKKVYDYDAERVRDRLDPERSLGHVDGHTMSAEAES